MHTCIFHQSLAVQGSVIHQIQFEVAPLYLKTLSASHTKWVNRRGWSTWVITLSHSGWNHTSYNQSWFLYGTAIVCFSNYIISVNFIDLFHNNNHLDRQIPIFYELFVISYCEHFDSICAAFNQWDQSVHHLIIKASIQYKFCHLKIKMRWKQPPREIIYRHLWVHWAGWLMAIIF